MKRLVLILLLGAVVAMTPVVAQADTVNAGDTVRVAAGLSRYNNGGEFILTDLTAPADPLSFVTFCLESNEYLNFGVNLTVLSVGTSAIFGGTGGASGDPPADPLDERTAFIYTMYRTGNPYGWTGASVQQAIWWIEDERTSTGAPTAPLWVTNGTLAGYMSDHLWSGLGRVRAVNIFYNDGDPEDGQDLLTLVPDGGMTLMLLGGALMGLGVLRRKFRG